MLMTIAPCGGVRPETCLAGLLLLAAAAPTVRAQPPAQGPGPAAIVLAAEALDAGEADQAERLATAYLVNHPGDIGALLVVVRARMARDEWDGAYEVISEAARTHGDDVRVHYLLGLVTRQLAGTAFERLVAMAPDGARVHQLQAEVFEAQERRADAEREYAAALEADPDLVEALLGLATLERVRLACPEAIAHYSRAEALRPSFDGAYGLGVCHAQLDQNAEAVAAFERAVARKPSAGVAWAWLGRSLVKLGRVPQGIEALERAVSLEPEMSEAHYALGMAYRTAGDAERSRAAFTRVQQLRARSPR